MEAVSMGKMVGLRDDRRIVGLGAVGGEGV